jgi:translation initiation factor IF-2
MAGIEKAQFALLAALSPEQFIEMAVKQGFKPEDLAKSTGLPPPKSRYPQGQENQADTGIPPSWLAEALHGPVQTMGAPPPSTSPPVSPPSEAERAAGFDAALAKTAAPPMGASPIPAPFQRNAIPPMGNPGQVDPALLGMITGAPMAPPTGALPPPPPQMAGPGQLNSLIAPNAAQGIPQVPLVELPPAPQVQLPKTTPDVVDMAAGALGGLADQYLNPPQVPMMGAPPTGQLPPQAPAMGNPGEVSPEVLAAVGAMPAPQAPGIVPNPNEAISGNALSNIVPPDSELGKIIQNFPGLAGMLPPTSAAGQLFGATPGTPTGPGAGLSAAYPPAPSQNVVDLTGVTGGPLPPKVPQGLAAIPPPVPPTEQQAAPTLKPISSATTETAEATKDTPSEGKPDKFLDALSKVQSPFGGKGGGGRGGAPGSGGVRGGTIQQGELLDLLLKSLRQASYTPGFIPYGKF